MTANDGGPAFPQSVAIGGPGDAPTLSYDAADGEGMSLRDYFAASALHGGLIAHLYDPEVLSSGHVEERQFWDGFIEVVSCCAYDLADAMLQERLRRTQEETHEG